MQIVPDPAKLAAGDEHSFRRLVEQFGDRVHNTVVGLVQDEETARDLTQEVFIEVFRSVSRFRGECALSTWIYRIAVTKSLEHLRSAARNKRSGLIISLFGKEDRLNVPSREPFYHPGVALENKERAAILFRAVSQLSLNQRTAFTLHKVEGLTHPEIAGIMTISVTAVESLIVRAKRRLRELLADYYEKNER